MGNLSFLKTKQKLHIWRKSHCRKTPQFYWLLILEWVTFADYYLHQVIEAGISRHWTIRFIYDSCNSDASWFILVWHSLHIACLWSRSLSVKFVEAEVLLNALIHSVLVGSRGQQCFFCFLCMACWYSIFHLYHSVYYMLFKIVIIDYWAIFNRFRIVHIWITMHLRMDFFPHHN